MLDKFSEMIRGNLSKMERLKLVALVTIEVLTHPHNTTKYVCLYYYIHIMQVHARDIIEKLLKAHCESRNAFEWQQQLRFYWVRSLFNMFQFNQGYSLIG